MGDAEMKYTLEFDMDRGDEHAYKCAVHGRAYREVLTDLEEKLRNLIKFASSDVSLETLKSWDNLRTDIRHGLLERNAPLEIE